MVGEQLNIQPVICALDCAGDLMHEQWLDRECCQQLKRLVTPLTRTIEVPPWPDHHPSKRLYRRHSENSAVTASQLLFLPYKLFPLLSIGSCSTSMAVRRTDALHDIRFSIGSEKYPCSLLCRAS